MPASAEKQSLKILI